METKNFKLKLFISITCISIFLTALFALMYRLDSQAEPRQVYPDNEDGTGLMITPDGNMGIEITPGFGIDLETHEPTIGFGF